MLSKGESRKGTEKGEPQKQKQTRYPVQVQVFQTKGNSVITNVTAVGPPRYRGVSDDQYTEYMHIDNQ